MSFKVGDRVRIYGLVRGCKAEQVHSRDCYETPNMWSEKATGTVMPEPFPDTLLPFERVFIQLDKPGRDPCSEKTVEVFIAHPKQCRKLKQLRRLKPKRRPREFWINEALLNFHLASPDSSLIQKEKGSGSGWFHVREVLEEKKK